MEKYSTGMQFDPTEREKIAYLLHKVTGNPLPCNVFVSLCTVDHYNEPWKIFHDSWNRENHFFTRLKKNDGDTCGHIEQGAWESRSPKIRIFDSRKQLIGFVRNYEYRSKKNADQDRKWHLRQYTLADKFMCCVRDECVGYTFCSLKKGNEGFVPRDHQEEGSLNIQSYFDQMLKENDEDFSSVGTNIFSA